MLRLLLLVTCFALVSATSYVSDFERVYNHIFSDYNKELPPNRNVNSSTPVKFGISGICLDINKEAVMKGRVWYRMVWEDERLAFNPEEFGNVTVLRVNPGKLWMPDIILYNRVDAGNPMYPSTETASNVLIYSTGKILWVPDRFIEAGCFNAEEVEGDDVWADRHCTLKYGSWTFDGNLMPLELYDAAGVDVSDWTETCPMEVVKTSAVHENKKYDCCPEPYPNLQFKFTLRRRFLATESGVLKNPRK